MCVGKVDNDKIFEPILPGCKLEPEEDLLATSTHLVKYIFSTINSVKNRFFQSNFYKILTETTQPAHLITALSVVFIAYLTLPQNTERTQISSLWSFIYLGSFAVHFGFQIWMTFVSGLALYFSLPRHVFGSVQKVLFPMYFSINSCLSLIVLTIFLKINNGRLIAPEIAIQACTISICFLIELIVRLYYTPPLLELITIKMRIEAEAEVGMEIGKLAADDLFKCPHYVKIHKAFRKAHMTIAVGNIITIACTVLHMYYLSQKMCLL